MILRIPTCSYSSEMFCNAIQDGLIDEVMYEFHSRMIIVLTVDPSPRIL